MIAVADPVPIYRRGLALVLREAGHDIDEWEHPEENLDGDPANSLEAVVMTIRSPQDLEVLSKVRAQYEQVAIVALIIRADVESYRQTLRAGASVAAPWDATAEQVLRRTEAALAGWAVLPSNVVSALAAEEAYAGVLSNDERNWLRRLNADASNGSND
jgi:DNA-binding NarL/FixJ family response regulator